MHISNHLLPLALRLTLNHLDEKVGDDDESADDMDSEYGQGWSPSRTIGSYFPDEILSSTLVEVTEAPKMEKVCG